MAGSMTADKALQMEAAELRAMIATLRHGFTIKYER
jgi:hypothetical protein